MTAKPTRGPQPAYPWAAARLPEDRLHCGGTAHGQRTACAPRRAALRSYSELFVMWHSEGRELPPPPVTARVSEATAATQRGSVQL